MIFPTEDLDDSLARLVKLVTDGRPPPDRAAAQSNGHPPPDPHYTGYSRDTEN